MADELEPEDIPYMEGLPLSLRSRRIPQLHLVHASPKSNNDGIGPWTSERQMKSHLDSIDESVLVCAHTHRQLHQRFADGLVVNVGSVGLPFNGDRRAQYAIFESAGDEIRFEFRQVDYDLAAILQIYEISGFRSSGGVTAELLILELENARPYLVPFLQWTSTLGVPPIAAQLDRFVEFYDPNEPFRSFFSRLEDLSRRQTSERGSDER
jgi:diadenosine tetraphosphatase ApaH/serine/threonine PP2A family protein phosphatase